MKPAPGYPAEFAFKFATQIVVIYPQLRPRTGGYGINVVAPAAQRIGLTAISFQLFGVPSAHNGSGGPPIPLISDGVDCSEPPPTTTLFADSWTHPGAELPVGDFGKPDLSDPFWKIASATPPALTGCENPALTSQWHPSVAVKPVQSTPGIQADEPSGLSVALDFPQSNDPTDPNTVFDPSIPQAPELKDAQVTLPAGVSISPSAAAGLSGCSDQASDPAGDQVNYDNTTPASCPDSSKIGTLVGTSPLLATRDATTDAITGAEPLPGDLYVLKPHPGDLPPGGHGGTFRVLLQVEAANDGINVKVPGTVVADPSTGQLTATFTENPQLPVKHLDLKFNPGPRAPLAIPTTCGTFTTTTDLVPWSTPGTPDAHPTSSFQVTSGPNGAACANTPQERPFGPGFSAGTESASAGASAPFVLKIARNDGEQEIAGLNLTTPPGFTAKLAGIPYCSEAAIAAASTKTGREEQASPSCPVASQVGTLTTGAGPGSNPYYVNGNAYLAGPYKGAPLSLMFITPAVAGPFDLGSVVVRAAAVHRPCDRPGDCQDRSDPAGRRRRAAQGALDRRNDRPARVRVEPDELQLDEPDGRSAVLERADGAVVQPLPGGRLRGHEVRAEVLGLDGRAGVESERGELDREGQLPLCRSGRDEPDEGESGTAEAASVAPDDASESVHLGAVRSEPGWLPGWIDRGSRDGQHSAAAGPADGARRSSSPTAAKRSPAS